MKKNEGPPRLTKAAFDTKRFKSVQNGADWLITGISAEPQNQEAGNHKKASCVIKLSELFREYGYIFVKNSKKYQ